MRTDTHVPLSLDELLQANFRLEWPAEDSPTIQVLRRHVLSARAGDVRRRNGLIAEAQRFEADAETRRTEALARIPACREELKELIEHVLWRVECLTEGVDPPEKHEWAAILPDTVQLRAERIEVQVRHALGDQAVPSKEDGDVLLSKGYDPRSWAPYILALSGEYGVPLGKALALFDLLGPTEAFDGFVTSLQDAEGEGE